MDVLPASAPASSREGSKPASMSWKLPALKKSRSSCTPDAWLDLQPFSCQSTGQISHCVVRLGVQAVQALPSHQHMWLPPTGCAVDTPLSVKSMESRDKQGRRRHKDSATQPGRAAAPGGSLDLWPSSHPGCAVRTPLLWSVIRGSPDAMSAQKSDEGGVHLGEDPECGHKQCAIKTPTALASNQGNI